MEDFKYPQDSEELLEESLDLLDFYVDCLRVLRQSGVHDYGYYECRKKSKQCAIGIIESYLDYLYNSGASPQHFAEITEKKLETSAIIMPLYPDISSICFGLQKSNNGYNFTIVSRTDISQHNIGQENLFIGGPDTKEIFQTVYEKWFNAPEKQVWGMFAGLNKKLFLGENN